MSFDPEIYRTILESLATGVCLVDRDRRILLWSLGSEHITGYLRTEMVGHRCPDDLFMECGPDSTVAAGAECELIRTMHDGTARDVDLLLRHREGQCIPILARIVPVRDTDGAVVGAAASFDEKRTMAGTELHPASHQVHDSMDHLTGIPDAESMRAHLAALFDDFAAEQMPFAVLRIRVDQFDEFRHAHGAKAAEMILRVVGQSLAKNLRPDDIVGRWSEDQFMAILADCPAPAVGRVAAMLKRFVDLAAIPWWGDRLSVAISIGGAAVHQGDTVESLISRAGQAIEKSGPDAGSGDISDQRNR